MDEALLTSKEGSRGGWRTIPFIIGGTIAAGTVSYGVLMNLVVFLIQQFNIASIDATQIYSIASGCLGLAPVFGALAADSCFGCFNVVLVASIASLLAMLLFTLTATLPSLRPPPCSPSHCQPPTTVQLAVFYAAVALLSVGVGGTRLNAGSLGVSQLENSDEQSSFLNWYFVALYVSFIAGQTGIVYIQVTAGWVVGFIISAAFAAASLLLFLSGGRYYRRSPKHARLASNTSSVDGFKYLLRFLPLILAAVVLTASMFIVTTMNILQALAMDRRLGSGVVIPAGSVTVFGLASSAVSISLFDRFAYPAWGRLTGRAPTPLQRVGFGYILNTLAMVGSAMVESRRLLGGEEAMSVMWLVPPLLLMGAAEALMNTGHAAFFSEEFPTSMQSMATGLLALFGGAGLYLSSAFVAAVRRITGWLQDDVNVSRLDKVYWVLGGVGVLNFACFLLCVTIYKKTRWQKI